MLKSEKFLGAKVPDAPLREALSITLPRFAWPAHLKQAVFVRSPPSVDEYVPLLGLELRAPMPRVSPGTHDPSVVMVENAGELELTWDWVDFEGKLVRYATIPAGQTLKQETWLGHVWVVSRRGERLGWFAAPARTSRLVVP